MRLLLSLIFASALGCQAEELTGGRWEGSVQIPDREIKLIVDLGQENGVWVGSAIIPGFDIKGAPLTDLSVKAPSVTFAIKGALGIKLATRLDEHGKLVGNLEQGGNHAPVTLTKVGPAQVEAPARSTAVTKEVEGEWKGDYEMFGYARHVTIKLANHGADGATAEFVIVGKKTNDLPVDLVTQEGAMVSVHSHDTDITYEGRLGEGKLVGTLNQGPIETPLILQRTQ